MSFALAIAAALLVGAEPAASATPGPTPTPAATSTPTPTSSPAPAEPRARFEAARAALLAGDVTGAERGFEGVAADPSAPPALAEAARVLADTCRAISARGLVLRAPFSGEPGAPPRVDRSGRGELAFFSTIFGIWVADGLGGAAGIEDSKAYLGLTLLGGAGGLSLSLALTRSGPISRGRAAAIEAATVWTSVNAATLCAIAGTDGRTGVATTIAVGAVALGATAVATRGGAPSEGDVSLVSSGGFWGLSAGALSLTFLDDVSGETAGWILLLGTDAGLVTGWALARTHELSRSRVLVIDAAGLLGGLAGVAIPTFADTGDPKAYGGATLAGIAGGLALGTWLTRDWDRDDAAPRASIAAPFATRLPDGSVLAGLAGRF